MIFSVNLTENNDGSLTLHDETLSGSVDADRVMRNWLNYVYFYFFACSNAIDASYVRFAIERNVDPHEDDENQSEYI